MDLNSDDYNGKNSSNHKNDNQKYGKDDFLIVSNININKYIHINNK